ncbi:MAG: Gfo/Idh/MocA family oxidoreductase [Thermoflexales bacterium]|nr:Gfo/Idh/MocA family oxidoreductase [Thermoflexales bacterium]
MTDRKFNWGVMGPGRIAHQFADGLQAIDDAALYAVASTNPARAQAFAAQHGGEKIYTSYEALVADPEVDAIYIATPHRFHLDNALQCLRAGKPVLCEKPLTVNAAEMQQLIDTARTNNVFLMEALWTRYLPIYGQIREWLDAQSIGELRLLVSTFGINVPKAEDDRWLNPELAGGTLLDMGVYPIAVSQWIMQQNPVEFNVQAQLASTGVDVLTAGLLKYGNGVISQFHTSFIHDGVNDFYIYGTTGHIRIHANYWGATQASLVTNGQTTTVARPFRGGGFEYQTEEAMRCIRAGLLESPGMTHAHTLANTQLMDQLRAVIGLKYPFEA